MSSKPTTETSPGIATPALRRRLLAPAEDRDLVPLFGEKGGEVVQVPLDTPRRGVPDVDESDAHRQRSVREILPGQRRPEGNRPPGSAPSSMNA